MVALLSDISRIEDISELSSSIQIAAIDLVSIFGSAFSQLLRRFDYTF
jgi:hypothetical protein